MFLEYAAASLALFCCDLVRGDLLNPPRADLRDVEYAVSADTRLLLDVYLPPEKSTSASLPAILLVHGGGWKHGNKTDMALEGEFYSRRGYVCVSTSYRLLAGDQNRWPTQLVDARKALAWMRDNKNGLNINPERIAALGVSAGGHIVSHLALNAPPDIEKNIPVKPPKCVVNVCGPTDFLLPNPAQYHQVLRDLVKELIGSDPSEQDAAARRASPAYHVSGGTSPVLTVHGSKDEIVSIIHANRLHEALENGGSISELLVMPGEGHVFSPKGFLKYRYATLEFLRKYL